MLTQAKPTFATSLTLNLYAVSMALPFVLVVLIPRSKGFGFDVLLLDFLALCTLLTTSIILSRDARRSGQQRYYLAGALAAVVAFTLSAPLLRMTGDYLSFKLKQSQLEVLAPNPQDAQKLAAAGIMRVEKAQAGVTLFVEDGEASDRYWGVAYSAADEKPDNAALVHPVHYWQHLSGHWYKWERYD